MEDRVHQQVAYTENTYKWLKLNTGLKNETEAVVTAAQDRALKKMPQDKGTKHDE